MLDLVQQFCGIHHGLTNLGHSLRDVVVKEQGDEAWVLPDVELERGEACGGVDGVHNIEMDVR